MRRIGIVDLREDGINWNAFREGMRDLGWVEGENIVIEVRWAEGDDTRFAPNIAELVDLGIECLVTAGATPSMKAKEATSAVPIVVTLVNFDALGIGLVTSISRPGGNITGSAGADGLRVQTKLVEIIKDAVPQIDRIAVLANPNQPGVPTVLAGIQQAAQSLGMQANVTHVTTPAQIAAAIPNLSAAGAQALVIVSQSIFTGARAALVQLTLAHRLPTITTDMEFPEAGGLMAYGVDRPAVYRYMATYVDKILKGAKPGDLPMERPDKYDLFLNRDTAQALGLSIPPLVSQQFTRFFP